MALPYARSAYQSPTKSRQSWAGRTVMTPYGPYVMQGASAGGVPIEQNRQAPQMSFVPVETGQVAQGPNLQNVYIQRLRQASMGNANPELQGGVGEVSVGNQSYRIPNALLQQMRFQDQWNNGRSNAVQQFFAAPQPQGMNYADTTVTQHQYDRTMNQNPQWLQDGPLNPFTRAKEVYEKALSAYNQIPQNFTERRSASGQLMGQDMQGERNRAKQQLDQANQGYAAMHSRGASRNANEFERQQLMSMQENFKRAQPTYSNLPIKETVYG